MSATAQDLLDAVNDAILYLVTNRGQEYQIAGRSFKYVDLAELRKWRSQLKREVGESTSAGATFPIQFT
jgi:hypothetical protein